MKIIVHTETAEGGRVRGTLTLFAGEVVVFVEAFDIPEEQARILKCEWDKP